jgi:glycerophosphoryl diester phosphodiesterase
VDTVGALHEKVQHVIAWTVNDTTRAAQLRNTGIDGITSDRSAVLRVFAMPPETP